MNCSARGIAPVTRMHRKLVTIDNVRKSTTSQRRRMVGSSAMMNCFSRSASSSSISDAPRRRLNPLKKELARSPIRRGPAELLGRWGGSLGLDRLSPKGLEDGLASGVSFVSRAPPLRAAAFHLAAISAFVPQLVRCQCSARSRNMWCPPYMWDVLRTASTATPATQIRQQSRDARVQGAKPRCCQKTLKVQRRFKLGLH
mmetsp:Transcript_16758/g.46832  ORF Transcript_16758/g.46832 Transcript_16758/m.46832 type:complete len:200 (-) Transcript_16758:40-639(-)